MFLLYNIQQELYYDIGASKSFQLSLPAMLTSSVTTLPYVQALQSTSLQHGWFTIILHNIKTYLVPCMQYQAHFREDVQSFYYIVHSERQSRSKAAFHHFYIISNLFNTKHRKKAATTFNSPGKV